MIFAALNTVDPPLRIVDDPSRPPLLEPQLPPPQDEPSHVQVRHQG